MANVVVSALATWNGKALKKAKSDVAVFDKQLKSLARTFGVTFSVAAVVAFSKKSVKAFAADELAAKSLALQLENTGNAFRVTEVENYIQGLEKTYAILTDLRKPFQTFLNLTRSVGLSQRTLEAALNISAGTTESLDTVVSALAAGIRGQTKAIGNLNTGIDANIIKSGDMNKIMAALEERFKGQAAARLDTYAGKMDVLKKSADEASKTIGKSLIGALEILSKDKSVSTLANDFENLGDNIAYAITQMAKLIDKLSALTSSPSFKPALLLIGSAASVLTGNPAPFVAAFGVVGAMGIGSALTSKRKLSTEENSALARARILNRRLEAQIIKLSNKTRVEEYDILKKKTALDKLKEKFDLERIGLTAALNQATDEETKTRLRAKITILDQDEAESVKRLAELEAIDALRKLADSAGSAGKSLTEFAFVQVRALINRINAQIEKINAQFGLPSTTSSVSSGPSASVALPASYFQDLAVQLSGTSAYAGMNVSQIATERARESGNRSVDVNLTVSSPSGDRFAQLMAESIQVAGRSGYSTSPNGGLQ